MGYFSNGIEGLDYQDKWCDRCVHDVEMRCPVWNLHLLYNGDGANNDDHFLHDLIPLSKDGLSNEQCRMFIERVELAGQHYKIDEP